MKAAVIGGAGLFGSAVIAELASRGLFHEITLIDGQAELGEAEVADLRAAYLGRDIRINFASQINSVSQSDVVIVCRGFATQSGESRFELARRNLGPFCWLLAELKRVGLRRDAVVIIAAEPTELMTALAASYLDLPPGQILGMGTVVDAMRLRAGLCQHFNLSSGEVQVGALGVRGKHLVPVWSSANIGGQAISQLRPWEGSWQHAIEQAVREADLSQLRGKGGAWRAPAAAVADVANAVVRDTGAVLPVCVSQAFRVSRYGLRRTSIALPHPVGRQGAGEVIEQKLWPKELAALKQGARQAQRDLQALLKIELG
ncbi:lactate/malate family dehydrogenase [Cerasicoccus fimbriatus]|uniref:lactate/malate family dehydrogenase n=1 Tax=Cerasicoccus fimbriatus TaxID=3014554 RepID=UPI0022B4148F|nr:hypothetical protein [Cerasicoccus sp. TK19100]